ncbi:hypothetical protein Lal_00037984 [Lupinus albus]|nr:hypothetical protein Lal_00037984 [Lupinus albus]
MSDSLALVSTLKKEVTHLRTQWFYGLMVDQGPFNFEKPKTRGTLPKLQLNPYSWSKWFKLYPEFLSNPLFISGESFAGVYIPTLAHEIVKGIEAGVNPVLNFKGYMIGNGVTDRNFDGNALVPFAHGMGLIPDQLFEDATKECKGELYGRHRENIKCRSLLIRVDLAVGRLNIYDILEPCYHSPDTLVNATNVPHSFRKLGETVKPLPIRKRMFGRAWPLGGPVEDGIVPSWRQLSEGRAVLCTDDEVATAWLNNDAVRKAIHTVDKSVVKEWDLCSDTLIYDHDAGSMIEYHRNLTSKGYRALIFSGDHDMCIPFTGSQAWTRAMGYKIVDDWRPWLVDDQVAGYTLSYDKNLTFTTIKGAGHTVPEYKPKESLNFYKHFLDGTPLDGIPL